MQEDILQENYWTFAYEINVYFKLPKPVIHDTSIVDNDINMTEFRDRCLKRFCKLNCNMLNNNYIINAYIYISHL